VAGPGSDPETEESEVEESEVAESEVAGSEMAGSAGHVPGAVGVEPGSPKGPGPAGTPDGALQADVDPDWPDAPQPEPPDVAGGPNGEYSRDAPSDQRTPPGPPDPSGRAYPEPRPAGALPFPSPVATSVVVAEPGWLEADPDDPDDLDASVVVLDVPDESDSPDESVGPGVAVGPVDPADPGGASLSSMGQASRTGVGAVTGGMPTGTLR
jgi:hypothetical protein